MKLHPTVTALAVTALVGLGIGACGSSSSGNTGESSSSSGSSSGASGGSSGSGSGSSSGGASGSSGSGSSSGGGDAGTGTSCTKFAGAACYTTGAPGYVCPSGTTNVTSCSSSNEIGSCTLVTSESSPDGGGMVTYSTIQYFYCTGVFSMTSAAQLQSNCASSKGTWISGSSVCGGDAASE